jgi:hypothetical protein
MPLRLSVEIWYWSMIQSIAERLPSLYSNASAGMPRRVR